MTNYYADRSATSRPARTRPIALWTWCALVLGLALAIGGVAWANQVPTSSSGIGPVIKTYPSGLTTTYTVSGTNLTSPTPSIPINGFGGITSAQMSPPISATTEAIHLRVPALPCNGVATRCSDRGTVTVAFNHPVTNPVLHVSALGGNSGTRTFHASMTMTGFVASGTPTLSLLTNNGNFQVTGNEIRPITVNGGAGCTGTPLGGCGSVRINGTVTSVTFRVDLLMGGSGTASATAGESFTITTSVDEDFGDAPGSYDPTAAASHIVGDMYMGSSVTPDNVTTTNAGSITPSPLATANASGDSGDNGVTFPVLVRGMPTGTIDVAVNGTGGRLQGWIDWADDGSFATAGDRIATDVTDGGAGDTDNVANGVIRLAVAPPPGAAITPTIARFRWSTVTGLNFNGLARNGEVEDYEVTVLPQRADLSLTKAVSNPAPTNGQAISYTLTLASAASPQSTATANGITVSDALPAGFTFSSASGTGTYDSGTGVWSVGTLAPGGVATLTINGTVTTGSGTVANIAQVAASSLPDPDSTVNNGATGEDDYATAAFTVTAVPSLPAPTCAAGGTQQRIVNGDFATGTGPNWPSWTATTGWTGTVTAVNESDTISGTLTQGGLSGLSFGPGAANGAVIQLSQYWRNGAPAASSTSASLTISVAGTPYARLTTPAGAAAQATVAYLNGATGNLTVINEFTFTGWRIELPTGAPATGSLVFAFVPNGGASSDDFTIDNVTVYTCDPGTLTVAKSSTVLSDTVSAPGGPFYLPGAVVRYCILVTNPSAATVTNVAMSDPLPAGVAFVPGSMRSGTTCAAATTVEDDDASDGGEADAVTMNFAANVVSGSRTSLAAGSTAAFVFNATVN